MNDYRDDADTVELIDYLRVLWRQKWVIALTFLAAVVTVWFLSDLPDPTYRVSTSLLLLPPLASELNADASTAVLAPEAYKQLALSTTVLHSVIAELPPSPDQDPPSIDDLRKSMSVTIATLSSTDERATARQILLSLALKGSDPSLLFHISEIWTHAFSATFESLFQDRTTRSYEYINQNTADTEAALKILLDRKTNLLLETPVDSLRSYRDLLQSQLNSIRTGLVAARLNWTNKKSLVAALEDERALQPKTYVLTRSISPDSLVGTVNQFSAREIETLASIQVQSEELNSTFISLDSRIATCRADIRALEEKIQSLEQGKQETALLLEEKSRELVEVEAQLHDLDREIALLESAYETLMGKLQIARIALAETPNPIQVIDEPYIPEQAIGQRKTSNVAIAGFLGLMLGTLLGFFMDYLQRVRQREMEQRLEDARDLEDLAGENADKEPQDYSNKK